VPGKNDCTTALYQGTTGVPSGSRAEMDPEKQWALASEELKPKLRTKSSKRCSPD